MKTIKNIGRWILVAAFLGGSTIFASCSDSDEKPNPTVTLAGSTPVYYNTLQRWLQINTVGEWKLEVVFETAGENWCTISPSSGIDGMPVVMTLTENESDSPRKVKIQLTAEGVTTTTIIEQLDPSQGDADNPPPPVNPGGVSPTEVAQMKGRPAWLELPATDKPYFGKSAVVTHDIKINNQYARNFTMLYDTIQKVAYWVAYPLSNMYLGSQKRTDKWAYDPKVPFAYQPMLTSGFPEQEGGKNKYDRGHQMPSADRTANYDANAQTFYFTNMTAQQWQFNQKIWANLEDKVRDWAGAADTLYVVTGAVLGTPIIYTKDKSGTDVAVPKNYYKALLSRKGSTYKAIGFWFENKIYDNNTVTSSYTKTINDLQTLTGFSFFTNLPDDVETTIKSQYRPQDWGL